MSPSPRERSTSFAALTAGEIAGRVTPRSIVIQPWGATEQHGPHLPLNTDTVIADGLSRELHDRLSGVVDIWTLPALPYGVSARHSQVAGTVSLSNDTMLDLLIDLGRGLAKTPVRKLVFLNAHGGNQPFISIACQDLRLKFELLAFQIFPALPQSDSETEVNMPRHGGFAETSLMLHLAPETVKMSALSNESHRPVTVFPTGYEPTLDFGWLPHDFSENGIMGDPLAATAEDGRSIYEAVVDRVATDLIYIDGLQLPSLE